MTEFLLCLAIVLAVMLASEVYTEEKPLDRLGRALNVAIVLVGAVIVAGVLAAATIGLEKLVGTAHAADGLIVCTRDVHGVIVQGPCERLKGYAFPVLPDLKPGSFVVHLPLPMPLEEFCESFKVEPDPCVPKP